MAAIINLTIHQGRTFHTRNDPDFVKAQDSRPRFKSVSFTADNTADNADTFSVDLADFGMTRLLGIVGLSHTTEDSVVIEEAPVTTAIGTVITVAIGGSTDNNKRFIIIYGV